jgi:hypothetical protein
VNIRTGFRRRSMAIGKIARDTGNAPRWRFEAAVEASVGWMAAS